jgi:hypothetical protein
MNDHSNRLEKELSGMRPVSISSELLDRIEAELAHTVRNSPWPDRLFLAAICSGAAAACVIVALLFTNGQPSYWPAEGPRASMSSNPFRLGDPLLAVSLADGHWDDILK